VVLERVLTQRRQLGDELPSHLGGERRGDADVVERPIVVVEAEQERADHRPGTLLVPAEAGDHAVGGARVLHLDHRALAGAIGRVEPLGHDPVEPGALEAMEPVLGESPVAGGRRQVHRRPRARQHLLEPLAPYRQRHVAQVLITQREQIPRHERGGRLRGQQLHPGLGGMDAQEQGLEVEPGRPDDDDLAVDDAALGQRGAQRGDQLGEVPVHRLLVTALQEDLVAVAEHQGPKAVPLRLELPSRPARQGVGGAGQHGRERRAERQAHDPILPRRLSAGDRHPLGPFPLDALRELHEVGQVAEETPDRARHAGSPRKSPLTRSRAGARDNARLDRARTGRPYPR
jgi:hypothetical protein